MEVTWSLDKLNPQEPEVLTLVNDEKSAGYYKVEFNATKLASGFYIYQLKAGSYLVTKKMIFIE